MTTSPRDRWIAQAKDPSTTTERLDQLAQINDDVVRSIIAKHPNLSKEAWDFLFELSIPEAWESHFLLLHLFDNEWDRNIGIKARVTSVEMCRKKLTLSEQGSSMLGGVLNDYFSREKSEIIRWSAEISLHRGVGSWQHRLAARTMLESIVEARKKIGPKAKEFTEWVDEVTRWVESGNTTEGVKSSTSDIQRVVLTKTPHVELRASMQRLGYFCSTASPDDFFTSAMMRCSAEAQVTFGKPTYAKHWHEVHEERIEALAQRFVVAIPDPMAFIMGYEPGPKRSSA